MKTNMPFHNFDNDIYANGHVKIFMEIFRFIFLYCNFSMVFHPLMLFNAFSNFGIRLFQIMHMLATSIGATVRLLHYDLGVTSSLQG